MSKPAYTCLRLKNTYKRPCQCINLKALLQMAIYIYKNTVNIIIDDYTETNGDVDNGIDGDCNDNGDDYHDDDTMIITKIILILIMLVI